MNRIGRRTLICMALLFAIALGMWMIGATGR